MLPGKCNKERECNMGLEKIFFFLLTFVRTSSRYDQSDMIYYQKILQYITANKKQKYEKVGKKCNCKEKPGKSRL